MGHSPWPIWGTVLGQDSLSQPSFRQHRYLQPPQLGTPQALAGQDGSRPTVGVRRGRIRAKGGRKMSGSFACSPAKAPWGVGAAVPALQHRFN